MGGIILSCRYAGRIELKTQLAVFIGQTFDLRRHRKRHAVLSGIHAQLPEILNPFRRIPEGNGRAGPVDAE